MRRDQALKERQANLKAVDEYRQLTQKEKDEINKKAQESRHKMINKLTQIEQEKQSTTKNFYKKRVNDTGKELNQNLKLLKSLEKKEKEIIDRLKNTYQKQENEIK
mmetsp:Transcript_20685/g.20430  ORF Transcript_20685/g.20430 Transcript_20685/m.20430 type:complete len:106 (-) Transcript_20685:421-738(-)